MATSSSTEKDTENEGHHERETFYKVKWVMEATGRSIPIALQGENGPCALLALLNIHLQRGVLVLPPGSQAISETRAMSMLAELALSSDAEAVQHFVELLPTLRRGMHVNVKFYAPTAFEITKEMTAFDCFPDVRLVHGWLVDPQDEHLVHAFADLSYNQVMDELVRISALSEHAHRKISSPKTESDMYQYDIKDEQQPQGLEVDVQSRDSRIMEGNISLGIMGAPSSGECEPDLFDVKLPTHLNATDEETADVIENRSHDEVISDVNADTQNCPSGKPYENSANVGEEVSETKDNLASVCPEPSPIDIAIPDSLVNGSGHGSAADASTSSVAEHATEVWEFFESFPTHLTYHGIAELNGMLEDGGTCILFRNSHFYVLRKHKEELYTLCTDVGFHRESDIVWELLRDINGDSDFYTALFHPSVPGYTGLNSKAPRVVPKLVHAASSSSRPAGSSRPTPSTSQGKVNGNARKKQSQNRNPSQQQIPFNRRKHERSKEESCIIQ